MNCRNCGAPMELFERRRYFFCTFCGSFSFIDTPEVEGVRVLERPVPALDCPLCGSPLAKALLDDAFAVKHCERCRGILLARATFAEAVARRRARDTANPPRRSRSTGESSSGSSFVPPAARRWTCIPTTAPATS